ncbi:hypothetical protein F5Y17DRAFT_136752 [Xylariaceae sp. FL0594]|nr:hypothetical protein F5Y17DRAFT_136752 [Xylariaceae sp. FL0594]
MPFFYSKNFGGRHFGTSVHASRHGVHRGPWRPLAGSTASAKCLLPTLYTTSYGHSFFRLAFPQLSDDRCDGTKDLATGRNGVGAWRKLQLAATSIRMSWLEQADNSGVRR